MTKENAAPILVLLLSRDRELGLLRKRVLELSGCRVDFPEDKKTALEALKHPQQIMVVAHTISRESANHYQEIFRAKNPSGKVLYVCLSTIEHPPEWADEVVLGLAGPEAMVGAVMRMAGRTPPGSD